MTIPEVAHGKYIFWERMDDAQEVTRSIADRNVKFFVQPTRADCFHSCTVDDIARVLLHVPSRDWEGIGAVLLRQPRRKEQTLASVWGRLAYSADLADSRGHIVYSGPAIVLEAVNPTAPVKFGKTMSVTGMDELDRLRLDGHKIKSDRYHTVQPNLESCRTTQLYRTLLHELGHWVDFLEKVERPSVSGPEDWYEKLVDKFHARPSQEREQFAHAYAERLRQQLTTANAIPFDRQLEPGRLVEDKLRLEDFLVS